MAHTMLKSCFVNLIAKRATLLEIQSLQYILRNGHKHYNPKFKKHRCLKNQLLPMHTENAELPTDGPNSLYTKFRPQARYWNEPRTMASHTYALIDPYNPLEDKERNWLKPQTALNRFKEKRKDKKATRDIQSFDEHFDIQDFLDVCEDLYLKANESIAEKDEDKMLDYLTPPAFLLVKESSRNKRIRWKFIKSLDLPHPLRIRAAVPQDSNEDAFAQITIRFHTQQTLAIYDRFGRLMLGSEILAKDVLEIVVFEKRISHSYGKWRIHQKIPLPEGETAKSYLYGTKAYQVIGEEGEEQQDVEMAQDESLVKESATDAVPPKESDAVGSTDTESQKEIPAGSSDNTDKKQQVGN